MKSLFTFFITILLSANVWTQCNVIATAMPQPATCADACDGQILYMYQNVGAPGVPYIVFLQDGAGNTLSVQTYMTEITTIPFVGLCPDIYEITVQGQSCSYTVFATVSAPPAIVAYANTTDPNPGMNDGSVELIASGGVGSFTFSLDGVTYQGSNIFSGLSPGTYTGYIKDGNGCIQTVSFTINNTGSCSVIVTANPTGMVTCYGACNGAVVYNYFDPNNNNPYFIELTQGGTTLQTATNNSPNGSGTFNNLCAGVYFIEVTDAQGCTGTYPITISQPSPITIGGVSTTDATAGNNNGTATINVTGGTPVYTYSIDGLAYQASNTFNSLSAGVYIAYVQDNAGCISIFTFVIQQDPGCFFNLTANGSSPACAGSCDGVINYIFVGSPTDPVFTIVLESNGNVIQSTTSSNQTVNGSFTGLCAGNYSITVTNSNGCEEVFNITLNQPVSLTIGATTNPASLGNNDGVINALVTGGSSPYLFSLDNQMSWQGSSSFNGLAAGVYVLYVQDANGCMGIYTVLLNETAGCNFNLSAFASPNLCANSCDGSIVYSFNDAGNNPEYTIDLIQNGSIVQSNSVLVGNGGTGQFLNLCEGIYIIQITDANGCTDSETMYVDSPDFLTITGVNVSNASAGNSDGEAELIVSGGTAPYQFSIDNGVTWGSTNLLTGLAAGFYIVLVEDANGCSTIFCFIVNEDPGCSMVVNSFVSSPISCFNNCDGIINYVYTGGGANPPYTVDLYLNGTVVNSATYTVPSANGSFINLCAGNYSVTVTDGNGCSSSASNVMMNQPDQIIISADVTNASTGNDNGIAIINTTGGTGQYSYSLGGINWQTSNVFNSLSPGVYIAYVQDENACTSIFTFIVGENANCNIVLTVFQTGTITCSGSCDAEISFAFNDINTNPSYTVVLTNSSGGTQSQIFTTGNGGSGTFNNLCAGTYTLSVQDANGCLSIQTIQITSPTYMNVGVTPIDATAGNTDGYATINVVGGTAPYQFSTDNQLTWQTSNVLTNLGAGVYIVYVKDANGCMQIFCFVLGDSNVASVIELNDKIHVYPNPTQGLVFIESSFVESVDVYNMNGQIIPSDGIHATNGIALDLSDFENGMYLLEVKSLNGDLQRIQIIKY